MPYGLVFLNNQAAWRTDRSPIRTQGRPVHARARQRGAAVLRRRGRQARTRRSRHAGKPTLLLLHGGPGSDHSIYKPAYSGLADIAQIIYLDHRGNGRSEDSPRESWNLAQWGDDVRAFCDALGIVNPIVLGASFGGMVALAYATRHPAHPSKLILISTEAASSGIMEITNLQMALNTPIHLKGAF
jgi:pimeloyl-ACP methyl ester carboxylesterase